jgi:hypothetical protein
MRFWRIFEARSPLHPAAPESPEGGLMMPDHLFIDARSRARQWLPVSVPCRSNGHLESADFGAKSAQYAKFI